MLPRLSPGEAAQLRREARANKDFAKGDAIRNLLTEAGVSLEDTPQGPRWSRSKG